MSLQNAMSELIKFVEKITDGAGEPEESASETAGHRGTGRAEDTGSCLDETTWPEEASPIKMAKTWSVACQNTTSSLQQSVAKWQRDTAERRKKVKEL